MGNLALSFESHSSMVPAVKHHGIGIGGWLLDSGKFLLSFSFIGLICNHIVPARTVTNDGSTHEATRTNDYEYLQ